MQISAEGSAAGRAHQRRGLSLLQPQIGQNTLFARIAGQLIMRAIAIPAREGAPDQSLFGDATRGRWQVRWLLQGMPPDHAQAASAGRCERCAIVGYQPAADESARAGGQLMSGLRLLVQLTEMSAVTSVTGILTVCRDQRRRKPVSAIAVVTPAPRSLRSWCTALMRYSFKAPSPNRISRMPVSCPVGSLPISAITAPTAASSADGACGFLRQPLHSQP